jgi:hypothetical protein
MERKRHDKQKSQVTPQLKARKMRPEIRPSIIARAAEVDATGDPIHKEEWALIRMNSYEREYLLQFVDATTLIDITEKTLQNCRTPDNWLVCSTYDEFAINRLIPELIRRFKEFKNGTQRSANATNTD